ncbi:MAG: type II toxin-antitoxin system VapC family toxin [Cyclobacteriaceae bacterium]
MNGSDLLIDTNIVIYLLGKDDTLSAVLKDQNVSISFITEIELLSYLKLTVADRRKISNFLDWVTVIQSNPRINQYAVEYRLKGGLKLPDAVIAATARYLGCSLLTADKRFMTVPNINVIRYERK